MNIEYSFDKRPTADQIIELYDNAGLPRPAYDKERIQKMFDNSNLIVTAWDNDILVGVSRSITDWAWACYLADLAVRDNYKKEGIGKQLINLTKEKVGEHDHPSEEICPCNRPFHHPTLCNWYKPFDTFRSRSPFKNQPFLMGFFCENTHIRIITKYFF